MTQTANRIEKWNDGAVADRLRVIRYAMWAIWAVALFGGLVLFAHGALHNRPHEVIGGAAAFAVAISLTPFFWFLQDFWALWVFKRLYGPSRRRWADMVMEAFHAQYPNWERYLDHLDDGARQQAENDLVSFRKTADAEWKNLRYLYSLKARDLVASMRFRLSRLHRDYTEWDMMETARAELQAEMAQRRA